MQLAGLLIPLVALQSNPKLGIKDVTVGTGTAAQAGDLVTVDYTGKLTSGKVFDSSKPRHETFPFVLGASQVIKGWDLGVAGMKAGGVRVLTIPGALAYGAGGTPDGTIPPNATLIFTVELHKIQRVKSEVLKKGTGPVIAPGDTVQVHYRGLLSSGKQFDSSYDRNQPMPVRLPIQPHQLIDGFTMGLVGMRVGEKKRIVIPPELGYGAKGTPGGPIPPNATLTFEIEIVKAEK